jgi:hypothetical protein
VIFSSGGIFRIAKKFSFVSENLQEIEEGGEVVDGRCTQAAKGMSYFDQSGWRVSVNAFLVKCAIAVLNPEPKEALEKTNNAIWILK